MNNNYIINEDVLLTDTINELTSRKQRAEIADAIATYKESLFQ